MIASIPSATLVGTIGHVVSVEVHVSNGLPGFTVVGLPDAAVRESRDRVRAAMLSSGLPWPLRRVTVNLAPSGIRKGGAGLDLPIAVGVLVASGELTSEQVEGLAFVGELGLDGSIRHVQGLMALADAAGSRYLVVPAPDLVEAELVRPGVVRGAESLRHLVDVLRGDGSWSEATGREHQMSEAGRLGEVGPDHRDTDLSDVRGQRMGRRALEISAAGGHHLLMVGSPGSGKTMLAERLPGVLPDLSSSEALEVSRVHSAAGLPMPERSLILRPPFRAPHHGASVVSLVGGGTWAMRPGEISLASRGVLFLDEMGEFPALVLDALRQPLEEGVVRVSRARGTVVFPARLLLVAAMNPCPCGEGGPPGACRCSESARARYVRRLSGPLLDRFGLVVPLRRPDPDELLGESFGEPSASVGERVASARTIARSRGATCNADIPSSSLAGLAPLTPDARTLLERRVRAGRLSARGLESLRRVARTIADLDGSELLEERHIAEAVTLRSGREILSMRQSR